MIADDLILQFFVLNVMLLEEHGDVVAARRAGLGILQPKLL